MYFKKYLIVKYENRKDNVIEYNIKKEKLEFPDCIKLWSPKNETAANVGIDNKNEILAASYLLNFKILAPVIAIPDLLTPGISDKIWKKPMKNIDLNVKLLFIFFKSSDLSLT